MSDIFSLIQSSMVVHEKNIELVGQIYFSTIILRLIRPKKIGSNFLIFHEMKENTVKIKTNMVTIFIIMSETEITSALYTQGRQPSLFVFGPVNHLTHDCH